MFVWAVLCVGITLVGLNALRQVEDQATDDAYATAERTARLLLANFERTADAVDGFLTNLAGSLSPTTSGNELHARFSELFLPAGIVQLAMTDAAGRLLASNLQPNVQPMDLSDREHVRVHQENRIEGLYISAPVLGRVSGMWTVQFTRAVRDGTGRLQAVLVASYEIDDYVTFFESIDLSGRGMASLVGLDGVVRIRGGSERTYGRDISDSRLFQELVDAKQARFVATSTLDGIDRLGYFATSPRYAVAAVVGIDVSSVEAGVDSFQRPIIASLLGLGLVLTLAMLAVIWMVHRQTVAAGRLQEAQRLEALGKLTGGIAHDFNNLLTIVLGSLDLLRRTSDEQRRQRYIGTALLAVERGKTLTAQLLAFSRRQALSPAVHDLNQLIIEAGGMLPHSLRSDILLKLDLEPRVLPVEIDADQFQIALINLAVNARDAMPEGGELKLTTRSTGLDEVRLVVKDTGAGMKPDVVARAAEPFFTTKEVGKGTGLGLAQVYGFLQQSGGKTEIESTPDAGTSVTLVFPRSPKPISPARSERRAGELPAGLRVLVVDDNRDIAALAANVLSEHGCIVALAYSGADGLGALRRDPPDVLLTDIVMPGNMDGIALARAAADRMPNLPVVLMTGYSERLEGGGSVGLEMLLKPFTPNDLLGAVRRALEAPGAGTRPAIVRA